MDEIFFDVSITMRVIAAVIMLVGVLPIQYREMIRANGLRSTKRLLFALGACYTFLALSPIPLLIFVSGAANPLLLYSRFLGSATALIGAIMFYKLYNQSDNNQSGTSHNKEAQ